MPHPFNPLSPRKQRRAEKVDYMALKREKADKVAKRAQKLADNLELAQAGGAGKPPWPDCASNEIAPANRPARLKSKPRKKSPTLSRLKDLLWDQERQVVYMESPDRCMTCGSEAPPVACHICPAEEGAIIKFFLPAIYRGCRECNESERYHRGRWRGRFEERFGKDFVDALYLMAEEENRKPIADKFQLKKHWVIEQTERMKKLKGTR